MTTLFATQPGRVAILPEDINSGLIMAIGGRDQNLASPGRGSYFNMRAIITQIQVAEQDDYQVQKSMSTSRYAFVFGPGVGNAEISGIAFTDVCQTDEEANATRVVEGPFGRQLVRGAAAGLTGLERICEYFDRTRISSSGQVYDMVLGSSAASRYKILLYGMTLTLTKPELRLTEFVMNCKVFK